MLVPQAGTEPEPLVVEALSINHWATREDPVYILYH